MKTYKIVYNDYIQDTLLISNDLMEIKDKALEIISHNCNEYKYKLSGINDKMDILFLGAWVEVWENEEKIESVDLEKVFLLK